MSRWIICRRWTRFWCLNFYQGSISTTLQKVSQIRHDDLPWHLNFQLRLWDFSAAWRDLKLKIKTYNAVHMPTAHMSTDGCEALSATHTQTHTQTHTYRHTQNTSPDQTSKCIIFDEYIRCQTYIFISFQAQNAIRIIIEQCYFIYLTFNENYRYKLYIYSI